jgi:hypothetical protein
LEDISLVWGPPFVAYVLSPNNNKAIRNAYRSPGIRHTSRRKAFSFSAITIISSVNTLWGVEMTRILYWNIQNFTMNTIDDSSRTAAEKLDYILEVFNFDSPPDIFVVVEVFARTGEAATVEGTVLQPYLPSAKACLALLNSIRNIDGCENWCLVPPLALGGMGFTEGVAVFYNPHNLQFTGPRLYYKLHHDPNDRTGQAQPVHQNTYNRIVDYPLSWKNCLPNPQNPIAGLQLDREWPFTIGVNQKVQLKEWNLAGEWQYWLRNRPIPSFDTFLNANRIQFPSSGTRAPFWTQFFDLESAHTITPRVLNLFTVHTSPGTADQAIEKMAGASEMTMVNDDAVNIILGDFNVDSFSDSASAYNWMINGIYTMHWDPRVGHAGNVEPARMPYCMTHYLPVRNATPFRAGPMPDARNNVYPRFGYMGSAWPKVDLSGAIDNVFTAYGQDAGGPPAQNHMTIINNVVGTPYNRIPAPAHVTAELTSGVHIASSMINEIPLNPPLGGILPPVDTIAFTHWRNFGKIRGTSDHLPLLIDV